MITQENEHDQMNIENAIIWHLDHLYQLLKESDRIEADEMIGHIAQFKAFWEDGTPLTEE